MPAGARLVLADQGLGTVKKQEILILRQIVMPVAQCHVLIAFGRQVRQRVAQRI